MVVMERLQAMGPNAEQITYWNEHGGPRWVQLQEALDHQLAPFGRVVMDRLARKFENAAAYAPQP